MHIAADKDADARVTRGFGQEWSAFRQDETNLARDQVFQSYRRAGAQSESDRTRKDRSANGSENSLSGL
jgi:hypothetical protein